MKKTLLTTLLLLSSYCVMAQYMINYSIGYGSYKMGDMKSFLENVQSQVEGLHPELSTAIVDKFPAYILHSVDMGYRLKSHEFGLKGGFYSTGGKISRQDYSGEYEYKVILNGYKTGLFYRNHFYTCNVQGKSTLSLFGEISPSVIISQTKLSSHFVVDNQPIDTEKKQSHKIDFSVMPLAGVRYNIIPQVGIQLSAGYEVSFGEKAKKLAGNPRIDWSGLRVSGGITLSL